VFWRKRKLSDFQAEIQSHLDLEADDLSEEGANPDQSQYGARREFGNVVRAEERFYESSRWIWLEQLAQDIRYSLRTLRNNPGFTAVAVLSLALGIGANTAVFSLVDAVVLKSLPVRDPNELRVFQWVRARNGLEVTTSGYNVSDSATGQLVCGSFSYAAYQMFRHNVPQFSAVVAYAHRDFTATANGRSDFASGQFVSGNYFAGLGAQPLIGRPILNDDDTPGRPRVAVLTYHYWEKRFGLDSSVVGKEILLNRMPVTIVGIMGPRFQGLDPGAAIDLFVPMSLVGEIGPGWFSLTEADNWWVQIFGRLRPGVAEQAAGAALQATLAHSIEAFAPHARTPTLLLRPGVRGVGNLRDESFDTLRILICVVALVLLIACLNLANLLVARSAARRREIAVRLSIGAGSGRLIRQLLTESLLLAGIGGTLGLLIAWPLLRVLLGLISQSDALGIDARVDTRALAFTLCASLLAGLLFGTLPAWRATRVNLTPALKEGTSGLTGATPRQGLNRVLVSAQVALSLLLLVSAALFVRTLMQLSAVDLGFRPERLLAFNTDAKQSGYHERRLVEVYTRLQQKITAIPGVESVAMSDEGLMQGSENDTGVYVPGGRVPHGSNSSLVLYCSASFLSTMRIPVLFGRDLAPADERAGERLAIVNQRFVEQYLPDSNPVGQQFYLGDGKPPKPGQEPLRIVGVAKNAHYTGVREELSPIAYIPYTSQKEDPYAMTFAIRTVLPPLSVATAVRRVVSDVDPAIPVAEMKTEEQQIAQSIGKERLFAGLVSAFGAVAALLAAIGLYGVMAYSVARRTVELGIRLALGAHRSNVQLMVLRQSLWMVLFGLATGIPAALALTRLIQKTLFGVKPTDPTSFVAAAFLMTVVGAGAAWIPARRASRVDPLSALRCE
jgi:predicted permease